MSNNLLISVVMSVYNGEKYLEEAINSILSQTYTKFEFIIIDDGSIDNTHKILDKYQQKDKRIKIVNNKINKGLIYSLNKGFEISKGKYIARMDADDIAEKNRLEEQIKFLEKNKDIVMCSTYVKIFKDNFKLLSKTFKTDTDYEKIKIKLLFRNYIAHPTIMIRKEVIDKYSLRYREEDKGMEDYALWLNLVNKEKLATIPIPLLKYRFLSNSISSKVLKDTEKYKNILKNIFNRELKCIFSNLSEEDLDIHIEINLINNLKEYKYSLEEKIEYLNKLKNILEEIGVYDQNILENEINEKIIECYINQSNFFKTLYINRLYHFKIKLILWMKVKLFLKKFIR